MIDPAKPEREGRRRVLHLDAGGDRDTLRASRRRRGLRTATASSRTATWTRIRTANSPAGTFCTRRTRWRRRRGISGSPRTEVRQGAGRGGRETAGGAVAARAAAPGRQGPDRLERPDDFGVRQRRRDSRRAALLRRRRARRRIHPRPHVRRQDRRCLLRRYRQQDAAIPGFLDDYAFFTQALLDLYETQFDPRDLQTAVRLTEKQRALFEDQQHGGFFSTARRRQSGDAHEGRLRRRRALRQFGRRAESAAPGADDRSRGLPRLGRQGRCGAFASRIMGCRRPCRRCWWPIAFSLSKPKQIILVGDPSSAETAAMLGILHARFLPDRIVMLVDETGAQNAGRLSARDRDHDAASRQNHGLRL